MAKFENEAVYYSANKSSFSSADEQTAESVYSALMDFIYNQIYYVMDYDAPVSTLLDKFWKQNPGVSSWIKDRVNDWMWEEAIDNGADLDGMSSWEWDGAHDGSDKWDYAPEGGFYKLALTIFNKWCAPELHLS